MVLPARLPKKTKIAQSAVNTTNTNTGSDLHPILQLQRRIGNQATLRLLNSGDTIQTGKRGKKRKKRKGKKQRQVNAVPPQVIEQAQQSGGFWSWLASFATYEPPQEDQEEETDPLAFKDNEYSKDSDQFQDTFESGQEEEEDEFGEFQQKLENPFAIEELEINLGSGKGETDTRMGTVKGEGGLSANTQGYGGKGKASVEGSMGKGGAEGEFNATPDKVDGKGKMEFLLGTSSEKKSGTLAWGVNGAQLAGSGEMENKVGLSGSASAKLLYDAKQGNFGAKGKGGAFLGMSTEGKVNIKFKSNGKDLGTTTGKLGLAWGIGGEIGGSIKWEGGELSYSTHGKLVMGVGFSYGYSFKINTNAIAQAVPGWKEWAQGWYNYLKFW